MVDLPNPPADSITWDVFQKDTGEFLFQVSARLWVEARAVAVKLAGVEPGALILVAA